MLFPQTFTYYLVSSFLKVERRPYHSLPPEDSWSFYCFIIFFKRLIFPWNYILFILLCITFLAPYWMQVLQEKNNIFQQCTTNNNTCYNIKAHPSNRNTQSWRGESDHGACISWREHVTIWKLTVYVLTSCL